MAMISYVRYKNVSEEAKTQVTRRRLCVSEEAKTQVTQRRLCGRGGKNTGNTEETVWERRQKHR